jgi:Family of unknown function (DUF6279)
MEKAILRWSRVCLIGGLLLLGACSSTTFVYNRLDFLIPWYVDDYVDLNAEQKRYLEKEIIPFLAWHRSEELPDYLMILEGVEENLDRPQTPEMFAAVFGDVETAWLRLENKGLYWLLGLGAQLSDAQIAQLMEKLWEMQVEYKEEYQERSDEEFFEDSLDESIDSAREYLGPLSDEQRELLKKFSRSLQRSDRLWLQERAQWLTELAVLLERKPGWQQRVRNAIAARRDNLPPDYRRVYEHNLKAISEVIAQLLNGRSEQQDEHLRDRLSSLSEDLEVLIAEGTQPAVTAAAN